MDSLKNISQFNTGSTIANGMALSESAIVSYKTAIDGLSLSQAQAALSSTALTDAQKEQILASAGLLQSTQAITLEEVKQMVSSASLSAQKKEEILTTLQGAYSENEWNMERLEAIAASGGEAGAIAQSILAKKAENAENVKGIASNKALTASLLEQLKARLALLAANPVAWIAGVAAVSVGLIALQKKLTKSLDECTEELSNFNSEVENAQSEADSLQTEWETCQKRLGELQKLADNGTISIIEQEEYERLLKTNDELERNIRRQKEKAQLSAIDAANSADETLSKTVESKYVTVNTQDSQGVEVTQTAWITPKEELNASIEEYKRLQTEIDRLKVSYDKGNISAEDYNTQLTDLTNQQTDARNRASEMSDILVESEQAYINLTNTGAELTTTQATNYNSVKQANKAYNDFLGTINGVDSAFENLDTAEKAQSLKNKYAAKKVFLPKGQGSYTVEDKEISDWIDTLSDEDLTVLASINFSGEQTKDSMQEALDYAKNNVDDNPDETDILSFTDLLNTDDYKDIKEKLLDLAKSGEITEETLSSTEEYNKLLVETGTSADSAKNQILDMLSAQEKLSAATQGLDKLKSAYAEFKNEDIGFVTAETLASLPKAFQNLPEFDLFSKIVGDPQSGAKKIQQAFNDICKAYLLSQDTLSGLVGASQSEINSYVANLKQMGVTNAQEFVDQTVKTLNSENKLINDAETEFYNMYLEYIEGKSELDVDYLKDVASKNGELASALGSAYKQDYDNWCDLLSQKAEAYNEFVEAVGGSYDESLSITGNMLNNGKTNIGTNDIVAAYTAQAEYLDAQRKADAKKQELKLDLNPIRTNFGTNFSPSTGNTDKKGKEKNNTEIDFIEKKFNTINNQIDTLQEKYDHLFSTKKKKDNLDKQIEKFKRLETVATKASKKYQAKADSITFYKDPKKDAKFKEKIRNGSYDITEYDSDFASKIQAYEGYVNKAKESLSTARKASKDALNAQIQSYQLDADNASAKIAKSQALAALDEGNYKKQNKRLEAQKKYLREQYEAQIKIAEAEGNTLEVERLRAELLKELRDNTKEQFDNIANTYDNKIGLTNNKIQSFQDQISLLEAKGQQIGSALYTKQMSLNNANEKKLVAEREKLIAKLEEIPKNTDDWYDAVDTLFTVDSELTQIQIDNANLQKSINQLKFDRFDDLLAKLNDIVDETDFLIDMLDSENFFDENGKITDDGITAMGLNAQKYDVYLAEAQRYKEQMAELERDYQNGDVDPETYEAKMREYKNGQQDMIRSANDVKKSLVSLVKEGLDKQNEALAKSVEEQKKLLQEQQKARSLNQTLEDQNKRIARIKKQLLVLEADNSESSRKTKRQLQSELDDLLKEQDNTLYDQSVEDQTAALDKLVEDSEKKTTEYLKNTDVVFVSALNQVNANTETVSKNIERISKETGVDINDKITKAWQNSGNAVSSFGDTITTKTPGIISQIKLIADEMDKLAEKSEKAAKAIVNATEKDYTESTTKGADSKVLSDIEWYISKNGVTPKKSPSSHSLLNQYIYKKTGKVIAEDKLAGLAKILGVKGVGKDTTADDRSKILKALKAAKFSSGGVIDAKNLIRQTGEDGIALVKHEEAVLTKPEWQSIRDLGIALTNLNQQIYKPYIPEFQTRNVQSPVYNIDSSITVEGVATNEIVKDMENMATKQAEKVVSKINNMAYAKGVRRK